MKIYNTTTSTISITSDGRTVSYIPGVNEVENRDIDDFTWQQYIYTGTLKLGTPDGVLITPEVDVATANLRGYAQGINDNAVRPSVVSTSPTTYNVQSTGSSFLISLFRYGSGTKGWYGFSETIPTNTIPFIIPMDCVMTNITYVSQNVATSKIIIYVIPLGATTQVRKFTWDLRQTRSACTNKSVSFSRGDKLAVFSDSSGNAALLSSSFPVANTPVNPWINITCQPIAATAITDFIDSFAGNFV